MPRPWLPSLSRFLAEVPFRREIAGTMVCGSFVTGAPGPRSDVDVHLVLRPGTRWRQRGNRVIDGIVVEYFANPPEQIRAYFRNDHADNRRMAATQFATGRILEDGRGVVRRLVAEARAWMRKPFAPPSRAWIELTKYGLFDHLDNLLDAVERGAPDAAYLYFTLVGLAGESYARFAREPVPSGAQAYRMLTSARTRRKYLAELPRDRRFARLHASALAKFEPARASALVGHVLRRMGGFELDGWRLRSKVET